MGTPDLIIRTTNIEPLFAKFSDIFGRKWILIFGTCIFLLGSVLCGAANVSLKNEEDLNKITTILLIMEYFFSQ
jgi:MFS family permease